MPQASPQALPTAPATQQTIYLIRGLPGSGKTTLATAMLEILNTFHVEADHFRMDEQGKYHFDPAKNGEAHGACLAEAKRALAAGLSVIVSNTFVRRWETEPYYALAREANARVLELTMSGTVWANIHGVPEHVVQDMNKRWEY